MRPRFPLRGYRAAQFTIATTMLAAPASALALTDGATAGTDHPSPSSIHVSSGHIAYGDSVRVTGRVPARMAGARVLLQSARPGAGSWRRVATSRVGDHGGWLVHATPRESSLLRAVIVGAGTRGSRATPSASRSSVHGTAVSNPTRVVVAAQVRVAARSRSVTAGSETTVSGHLLPARADRLVAVQDHTSRGWEILGRAHTGAAGGFAARFAARSGADRRLRVMFAGDRLNSRATGGAGSLALYSPVEVSWYDDAGSTACGFHAGDGVASRTLPCGTKVAFRRGDRSVVATVDDRGPYVYSREFDLNQTTAGALGFSGVGMVEADVQ